MPEITLSITHIFFVKYVTAFLLLVTMNSNLTLYLGPLLAKPPKKAQKCENVDLNIP